MKVYRLECSDNIDATKLNSISIDPGISTSGFCFLNKKELNVHLETLYCKMNMNSSYPEILAYASDMTNKYIRIVQKQNILVSECELNIEYTFAHGIFSPGLFSQITYTICKFVELGIQRINFVPPKIPGYFIRKQKIDDNFLKKWIEIYLPQYYLLVDSPHSIDALLISLFLNYDIYAKINNNILEIRKPEYEVEILQMELL